jgi:cytochrome c peroxidase
LFVSEEFCHGGTLFSDFGFHNNGLDDRQNARDDGSGTVTGRGTDKAKFKTSSLRNVAVTGPYMQDGRFATLEEVVGHYVSGVKRTETLDPNVAKHPEGAFLYQRRIKRHSSPS